MCHVPDAMQQHSKHSSAFGYVFSYVFSMLLYCLIITHSVAFGFGTTWLSRTTAKSLPLQVPEY